MYYIYLITNQVNGKNYIGQRKCPKNKFPETDIKYMGSGYRLQFAQEKYGIENFSKEILAVAETQENIDILERVFIALYRQAGKAEYNVCDGGQIRFSGKFAESRNNKISVHNSRYWLGKKRSVETCIKLSKANKGKHLSEETKQKMSISMKGKRHKVSEETKQKISKTLKGCKAWNKGKTNIYSEETRKRMGAHKGKTWKVINGKRVWLEKK